MVMMSSSMCTPCFFLYYSREREGEARFAWCCWCLLRYLGILYTAGGWSASRGEEKTSYFPTAGTGQKATAKPAGGPIPPWLIASCHGPASSLSHSSKCRPLASAAACTVQFHATSGPFTLTRFPIKSAMLIFPLLVPFLNLFLNGSCKIVQNLKSTCYKKQ